MSNASMRGDRSPMQAELSDTPPLADAKAVCGSNIEAPLTQAGTRFRVRRGQQLPHRYGDEPVHYYICDSVAYLQSDLPGQRRAIIATYYPGDLSATLMIGNVPSESVTVADSGFVVRVRVDAFLNLCVTNPRVSHAYAHWMHMRAARVEAHAVVVGRLTGEERVAAYLIESGRMRGEIRDRAVHIDLPFSREEVADYLALNPDTLSRFLTRLKSEGIVTFLGHRRAVVTDWAELVKRCPIADMLLAVFER